MFYLFSKAKDFSERNLTECQNGLSLVLKDRQFQFFEILFCYMNNMIFAGLDQKFCSFSVLTAFMFYFQARDQTQAEKFHSKLCLMQKIMIQFFV